MISTKGRYALRVMIDLAGQKEDTFVPLHDIALRQGISEKYLEIIIKTLVRNKMVKGHRGKGGGYMLSRKPEEYTVWEILDCTEENLAPVACLAKNAELCPRKDECKTIGLWEGYDNMTREYFEQFTLRDML